MLFKIKGTVRKGRSRGAKLSFPTANIYPEVDEAMRGVYAVLVKINDNTGVKKGVANVGYAPTFAGNKFSVEVHIFDFDNDLIGKEIEIEFMKKIRDEKKFRSARDLKERIKKDCAEAKRILKTI